MKLTLQQVGTFSYKHICQGRKSVGRVWQHAETKVWHGLVNTPKDRVEATGATEQEAFRNVASKTFGFDNPDDLLQHNREVRQARSASKARAKRLTDDYLRTGNIDPLLKALLGK